MRERNMTTSTVRGTLSRRQLLLGSLGAGLGLSLLRGAERLARAAGTPGASAKSTDRYYVFCYFSGGWDVLLGLDPRDPNVFNADAVDDTKIQPAYELLKSPVTNLLTEAAPGMVLGPYVGDLAKHGDKLAVVRGMSMDTLTHEVGRRRFLTGKPPSGLLARGSSIATWMASLLGEEQPIPNLSSRVESYNTELPNFATGLRVNSVPDLVRALKPGAAPLTSTAEAQIEQLLALTASCPESQASPLLQAAEVSRQKLDEVMSAKLDALFDFQAKTEAMSSLRSHYGIADTGTAALASPGAQAALASQALKNGVSRVVSIEATSGLDTHYDDWQSDHGPRQMAGMNAVARLIEDLAASEYAGTGTSWLDHTVIVGFSEFSRSPLVNDRGGRDHWLGNSCFLAGGPIQGGKVIGASSDLGMNPQAVNLKTGALAADGAVVRPEHVLRALFHDLGVEGDPADLREDPLLALLKTA